MCFVFYTRESPLLPSKKRSFRLRRRSTSVHSLRDFILATVARARSETLVGRVQVVLIIDARRLSRIRRRSRRSCDSCATKPISRRPVNPTLPPPHRIPRSRSRTNLGVVASTTNTSCLTAPKSSGTQSRVVSPGLSLTTTTTIIYYLLIFFCCRDRRR